MCLESDGTRVNGIPQVKCNIHSSISTYIKLGAETNLYLFRHTIMFNDERLFNFGTSVKFTKKHRAHQILVFECCSAKRLSKVKLMSICVRVEQLTKSI